MSREPVLLILASNLPMRSVDMSKTCVSQTEGATNNTKRLKAVWESLKGI